MKRNLLKNLWLWAQTTMLSGVGNARKQITAVPINASRVFEMIWET